MPVNFTVTPLEKKKLKKFNMQYEVNLMPLLKSYRLSHKYFNEINNKVTAEVG